MRGRRRIQYVARERRSAPRRRLRWSWLVIAALIALAVGGLSYLRVWPPLATVMSASMAPTIKTGDIVVLKKLERPAQVGEIVAISVPEDIRARYGYPPVVIHRVISIDADDVVTTKGDAYKEPDPFDVPRSALTTKVVATLPAAGRALAFLGSGLGLLWLAGGALLLVGMPLLERQRESRRRELTERDSLHSTLQAVTDELALLRTEPAAVVDPQVDDLAELRTLLAEERRAAAGREAALAEELRAFTAAAAEREAAAAETLQAVTASVMECVHAANRRAETAEQQLRAHLEQLPAQIERAVALDIASHVPVPPPPPPPAPARSGRFVAASQWAGTAAWDAREVPA